MNRKRRNARPRYNTRKPYTRRVFRNTLTGYSNGNLINSKTVRMKAPNNRAKLKITVEGDTYLYYVRVGQTGIQYGVSASPSDPSPLVSEVDLANSGSISTQAAAEILKYKDIYKAWRIDFATAEFIPERKPIGGDVFSEMYVKWQNTSDPLTQQSAMNQEPVIAIRPTQHRKLEREYPRLGQQYTYDELSEENKWQAIDGSADFVEHLGFIKIYQDKPQLLDSSTGASTIAMHIHLKIIYELTGDTAEVSLPKAAVKKNLRQNELRNGALNAAKRAGRIGAGTALRLAGRSSSNPAARRIADSLSRLILNEDL